MQRNCIFLKAGRFLLSLSLKLHRCLSILSLHKSLGHPFHCRVGTASHPRHSYVDVCPVNPAWPSSGQVSDALEPFSEDKSSGFSVLTVLFKWSKFYSYWQFRNCSDFINASDPVVSPGRIHYCLSLWCYFIYILWHWVFNLPLIQLALINTHSLSLELNGLIRGHGKVFNVLGYF